MNSILGAIVRNMQVKKCYTSGVPDRGWGFVAQHVASAGATEHDISPEVAEHPKAEPGFVLSRQRPVVERTSPYVCRLRRLVGIPSLVYSSIGPSRNRSKSIIRSS